MDELRMNVHCHGKRNQAEFHIETTEAMVDWDHSKEMKNLISKTEE